MSETNDQLVFPRKGDLRLTFRYRKSYGGSPPCPCKVYTVIRTPTRGNPGATQLQVQDDFEGFRGLLGPSEDVESHLKEGAAIMCRLVGDLDHCYDSKGSRFKELDGIVKWWVAEPRTVTDGTDDTSETAASESGSACSVWDKSGVAPFIYLDTSDPRKPPIVGETYTLELNRCLESYVALRDVAGRYRGQVRFECDEHWPIYGHLTREEKLEGRILNVRPLAGGQKRKSRYFGRISWGLA